MEYLRQNFSPSTVKGLFEKSVTEHESNTALIFNEVHLSYKELNARANKVAHFLIAEGVNPGDLVPICLHSGIDMIIGLIGILKAGGAYVPIDPDFPEDRIYYILNDCRAKIVITAGAQRRKFSRPATPALIELDTDIVSTSSFFTKNPVVELKQDNLAYIMYTSGTTGMPNGVMIPHLAVVNNLIWAKHYFNTGTDEVVLQKTTFCFDVSVWEIFWPLISGSVLVIVSKQDYRDINNLKRVIDMHKITAVHFVPTMLELFMAHVNPGECGSIKRIIASGEALTPFQANLTQNKMPGAVLYDLYGPTETTIHSTYWQVPKGEEIEKVLIGKPVDNTEIFILDENMELLPDEGIGEIYIGGAGVARGYLNKPELTAERFINNPFSNTASGTIFKTGDFGRYMKDGNIEYLGRMDEQVKINGYRIELESVENNIKNSGVVKHAVVLTRKNNLGFRQIVAYVTLNQGNNIQDLWDYLVTKLPGYMLPTNIREVENIPVTLNGKVDKDLLLSTVFAEDKPDETVPPGTELEHIVYNTWKTLLNADKIGIYDNFFELGGNSIMAVKMLSMLKQQTNQHISLLLLNQFPTIASLAKLLAKPNLVEIPNILIPIKPEGTKPPVYLVNAGGLVADGFFNLSDELDVDQPVFGFQSNGYDSNGQVFKSMEEIAAQYVKGILKDNPHGPYCLAGYSLGGIIAFEMAQQLKAIGKEVKMLAMVDSLTRDPELIKTKYNLLTVIRMMGLNVFLLKQNPVRAIDYTIKVTNAAVKKIFRRVVNIPEPVDKNRERDKNDGLDIFGLHISAYLNYHIKPYDGNIVVLRAKEITFYMDDFKYLGWKDVAKNVKSIGIRGQHLTIFDNANITEFGKKLQTVLDEGF